LQLKKKKKLTWQSQLLVLQVTTHKFELYHNNFWLRQ
jgi:hypothetical protein